MDSLFLWLIWVVFHGHPRLSRVMVTVAAGFEGLASELFEVGNKVLTFG